MMGYYTQDIGLTNTRVFCMSKPAAVKAAPPKKRIFIPTVVFLVVAGVLVWFCLPSLLLCAGLLPALIAMIADRDPRKSEALSIGFMNLAGVLPFMVELWEQGQTMEHAAHLISQPFVWVIMLGAAMLGKMLIYALPPAVNFFIITRMESRLRSLRAVEAEMSVIWGEDIGGSTNKSE